MTDDERGFWSRQKLPLEFNQAKEFVMEVLYVVGIKNHTIHEDVCLDNLIRRRIKAPESKT